LAYRCNKCSNIISKNLKATNSAFLLYQLWGVTSITPVAMNVSCDVLQLTKEGVVPSNKFICWVQKKSIRPHQRDQWLNTAIGWLYESTNVCLTQHCNEGVDPEQ
jgi:hypothetical protein